MSPLQHYREAERLLAVAKDPATIADAPYQDAAYTLVSALLAEAQVHATLATVEAHTSTAWSATA